jgi:Dolichyl-phosphate-mannose-protein mannosyltransferase
MARITNIQKILFFSLIIRCILAAAVELGNDEVYYTLYARFPEWSYFDHPPMVGWVIRLFSLDMMLQHEFFIRLGAVFFGTVNTWGMYVLGKKIKDERTGIYAALLYNASIYCSIIAGVFILPDSPQLTFWLGAIFLMLEIIDNQLHHRLMLNYFLLSICIGLAMLSKYHALYLWGALGLFFLLFQPKKILDIRLWLAGIFSIVIFSPVIYWNVQNDWISFTFHENRVAPLGMSLNFTTFGQFFLGQVLYQNPFNGILVGMAFFSWHTKPYLEKEKFWLLWCLGVPLVGLFTMVSLFRATLPHWSGPGFLSLFLITAAFLSETTTTKSNLLLKIAFCFTLLVAGVGVAQINFGVFDALLTNPTNPNQLGSNDPTLDMYGWKQLAEKAMLIIDKDANELMVKESVVIICNKWFPAAHLDFYVAMPARKKVTVWGGLNEIHQYYWINSKRGALQKGDTAYCIVLSTHFTDPSVLYENYFSCINFVGETSIFRNTRKVKSIFIYRLSNYGGDVTRTFQ